MTLINNVRLTFESSFGYKLFFDRLHIPKIRFNVLRIEKISKVACLFTNNDEIHTSEALQLIA